MPTDVVIIGAGPAGLTLANLLQRNGIGCVVLEARDRSYVEQRQRAGVLDDYGGRIFADAGLAGEILAGAPSETFLELRYEGEPHLLDVPALAGGRAGRIVPQQLLVRRLLATFLAAGGRPALQRPRRGAALAGDGAAGHLRRRHAGLLVRGRM